MIFRLPTDALDLIYEYAGAREWWKTRFSYDVLPLIDKGNRFIGYDLVLGVLKPCANCYWSNVCNDSEIWSPVDEDFHVEPVHRVWDVASFEDIRSAQNDCHTGLFHYLSFHQIENMMKAYEFEFIREHHMQMMIHICKASEEKAYARWWGW